MAHTYVKVKHQEKVLKLRPATVSVTNLAMIFKLEAQQGIYIHSEEEAEIILPSESGTFLVEDFSKTYVVNGEPAVSVIPPVNSSQSPSTSLGIPISYQQPRSKTNPPPGNGRFERPTFKVVKSQGWKKFSSLGHIVFDKIISSSPKFERGNRFSACN